MAITIKDIAKDTNLSLATISKYLNGKNISSKNRQLVEESIRRLGYIPSKTAQLLRARKGNTICVLAPSFGDYYWSSIFRHIEEYFRSFGYSTIILSYDTYSRTSHNALNLLISSHTSGVILIPFMEKRNNIHHLLADANIPFVCLDQQLDDVHADTVTSDNYQSAYDATMHFTSHGHRRIYALAGEDISYTSKERLHGFYNACKDSGLRDSDYSHITNIRSIPSTAKDFCHRLTQEEPPTALLSLGYDITITFLSHFSDTNLSIPTDVSLISFDDDIIFSAYPAPITVVTQDLINLAKKAAYLLHERIKENDTLPIQSIHLPTKMIERKSVASIR